MLSFSTLRIQSVDFHTSFDPFSYRVCQGLWPSLMFADEDIEQQNFWASSKSHVATTDFSMHFCNYIGWSDQGKSYEIEVHFAKQYVATYMTLWCSKNLSVRFFCLKTQADWLSRLATGVTISDTHGIL